MNENSNEENQLKDVTDILRRSIKSRVENDDDFYDKVLRKSQSDRASIITDILRNYKDQQKERFNFKKDKQKKLLYVLLGIIGCLTVTIIVLSIYFFRTTLVTHTKGIVAFISSIVTYLTVLISVLLIIVKYVFPEDEEKNFNDLVSKIIENDTVRIRDDKAFNSKKNF